jgi:hypothetical protein
MDLWQSALCEQIIAALSGYPRAVPGLYRGDQVCAARRAPRVLLPPMAGAFRLSICVAIKLFRPLCE